MRKQKRVIEDRLDVDLSCNNEKTLDNTQLLLAYSEFDHKVRDLVILVKQWAKAVGVLGLTITMPARINVVTIG